MMSAVASSPSTPGLLSAVSRRRSRSYRSAIALATPRTPSEPRAGWSAATIMRRPSAPSSGRRLRSAARAAIISGCLALSSRSSSNAASNIGPPQEVLDLFGSGHGRRAFQPGGDDRPGRVGEPDDQVQRPAGQQPVAQSPAEPVPGADPVDHLDPDRRNLYLGVLGP